MNPAQRSQLLRARFKAKPVVKAVVGVGLARAAGRGAEWPRRVRYVVLPTPKGRGYVSLGAMQSKTPPSWVRSADVEVPETVQPSRTKKKSALTRIAERWGEKNRFAAPRNRR